MKYQRITISDNTKERLDNIRNALRHDSKEFRYRQISYNEIVNLLIDDSKRLKEKEDQEKYGI